MDVLTVSEFGKENAVWYTLENDTTLSVEFVNGLLPCETIDNDETGCTNAESAHHSSIRRPNGKRSQNKEDGRRPDSYEELVSKRDQALTVHLKRQGCTYQWHR